MNISNTAIGFLVGAGVAAGAGGAYLATKPSAPVAAIAGQADPAVSSLVEGPVEQSEAIVAEEPEAVAVAFFRAVDA